MAELKILHNPRCSKSRQTLTLLQEKGYDPVVVEYLKQPLSEAEYKEAGLQQADTSDDERFAAMAAHPKLIERPVVINGDKAKIGRPPESVLDIL